MQHLTHVYWYGDGVRKQAPLGYLCLLLSSPTLRSLTLSNVWLRADGTNIGTVGIGVRELHIDFSHLVQNIEEARPEFLDSHLACFDSLIDHLRPQLERLTLSGCAFRLSSLASGLWPSLRSFTLTRGDATLDCAWAMFLAQTPMLYSLTVALSPRDCWTILLPVADASEAGLLSRLRHFTISFPRPEDHVFRSLPGDLQELSLRDSPRYYTMRRYYRTTWTSEPLQSSSDVIRIFTVLSAANLNSLELAYLEDDKEFQMLALLSQSCPNLRLLELHRYPATPSFQDAWYKNELRIPVDAIADSLAAFECLRVLKLNLSFTDADVGRHKGTIPLDYWDRLAEFIEAQRQTIVARLPQVKMLSILHSSRRGMGWHTWSIRRGDSTGNAGVVYEDIYDETFYGWKDWDWC
ncbi:hypothetical protein AURDEDRAFT_184982 [Auricularia subglabra TFB-10046 SS5]|uniref:F-box domain-containing protein n=1 Tax=Auricularia subglabra (strain TFB-10046 / SS5) TaxID=717982 RepID=J0D2Z2_AURST|nr:hypothetical protein AURDEDRAFT_184982 [Auricularia subglabra TFB-10046 SS5]